jgi:hypothetical protein
LRYHPPHVADYLVCAVVIWIRLLHISEAIGTSVAAPSLPL